MDYIIDTMSNLIHQTAFFNLTWGNYVLILVAFIFLYLAIAKGFEPLLLVPISFGMLLVNMFPDIMISPEVEYYAVPDLYGCRCDDGLWTIDCKPKELLAGCRSTVWYLCSIFLCYPDGIQWKGCCCYFYHRWSRWPDINLPLR